MVQVEYPIPKGRNRRMETGPKQDLNLAEQTLNLIAPGSAPSANCGHEMWIPVGWGDPALKRAA